MTDVQKEYYKEVKGHLEFILTTDLLSRISRYKVKDKLKLVDRELNKKGVENE